MSVLPIDVSIHGRGRRSEDNRAIMNGLLWRLRCRTPWRDVSPKYGS
tara:strand:- start:509 stop:649 length:141 start_codon:yes stop_codon:yes gene_type:complete